MSNDFILYRREGRGGRVVVSFDAEDMDAAIDVALRHVGTRSADLDAISNDCTMIVKEYASDDAGVGSIVEFALVEARDWCVACGRDYDAMTFEERARHRCHGEYVTHTCKGHVNAPTGWEDK